MRRAHINQHDAEVKAEVDAGMDFADQWMFQFNDCGLFVGLLITKKELAPLFQEKLVNRLVLLDDYQRDDGP